MPRWKTGTGSGRMERRAVGLQVREVLVGCGERETYGRPLIDLSGGWVRGRRERVRLSRRGSRSLVEIDPMSAKGMVSPV